MPASTILLLESDPSVDEFIADILTGAGYKVTRTVDPDEALHGASDHQLLIIDVASGPRSAIEICAQIRSTPALAQVPVMCVSASDDVEERIRFLEAGADDVMARPFDARELHARVEALLLRFQRSKDLAPVLSGDGMTVGRARRSVAVYSPKGGVGTTTIATNIAVAAALKRPDRVVLIDLALQFGGVATHLNLRPRQTLADLVRDDAAMREPELMRGYAVRHDSGLHVLAAPAGPEAAETISAAHVARILATALEGYDLVVVDAGSALDERVLTLFEAADTVILPVYAEIAALKAMHALLEYLSETGSVGLKSMFVLNNPFAREILKLRDVESALGSKVAFELPYDPFLYLKAVNEGIPIVVGAVRSAPAERLVRLSASAFGEDGVVAAPVAAEPKKSGGLFRRRR
ncbi:MAG: AAA family ATPase [Candidatus Limnocylindrales bacterium]|nr:AAA family ATPase [Candidatus Limnocylindrales bacterium]